MTKTPIFIIEEHHEAFFIWNYAVINGLIPASGNTLLHIDQHADTSPARFYTSIKSLSNDLRAIGKFTYNELGIGIFIPAALYQGLFKELYWLQHNKLKVATTLHIYSYNQAGQALLMTANIHEAGVFSSDRQSVDYQIKTAADTLPTPPETVVLDIDLDYFSCAKEYPWQNMGSSRVEITEAEYERITTNKYHPLRLSAGGVKVHRENGRYYLLVNAFSEAVTTQLKVSPEQILHRIELLAKFLQDNQVRPQLIDICRSRFSGFTPEDQWEFIEHNLLEKLNGLYNGEVSHISEIWLKEKLDD
jgi:hypothetical protein